MFFSSHALPESMEINTQRLVLRQWKDSDYESFCKMNADQEVMEFFPDIYTEDESIRLAKLCKDHINQNGWGLWAVEEKKGDPFIGFVGLNRVDDSLPFSPNIEIGWRLARKHWGRGYAGEAARVSLEYAFGVLCLSEVVSFTPLANMRSRAVMRKIGMKDSKANFHHPKLPLGHDLCEHVLYRICQNQWRETYRPKH